ncbi:MAG: hypothetical protein Q9191_003532, partial [Dirinaria sp. TL-2023a]
SGLPGRHLVPLSSNGQQAYFRSEEGTHGAAARAHAISMALLDNAGYKPTHDRDAPQKTILASVDDLRSLGFAFVNTRFCELDIRESEYVSSEPASIMPPPSIDDAEEQEVKQEVKQTTTTEDAEHDGYNGCVR